MARQRTRSPRLRLRRTSGGSAILIEGARTQNLKNISCRIPHGRLTVITGVSGAGKSSLAFDTLYAEGQRRYVESLSTYARLFLERMERPDVDRIENIPPAIPLKQKNAVKNARSTVGTITEINDSLRLLYAKVGTLVCPECEGPVRRETPESAASIVDARFGPRERLVVVAPVPSGRSRRRTLQELVRRGFYRLWLDGRLEDCTAGPPEALPPRGPLPVVVDRLALGEASDGRVREALGEAFRLGAGQAWVEPIKGERLVIYQGLRCNGCARAFEEPVAQLFSFNSPLGACSECEGFGRVIIIDRDKVIPDPALSLDEGAVAPWRTPGYAEWQEWMLESCAERGIPTDVPYRRLPARDIRALWRGWEGFGGIEAFFDWMGGRRYRAHVRIQLSRYRGYVECRRCCGRRLKEEAQAVRIEGRPITDIWAMSLSDAARFFETLKLEPAQAEAARNLLREVRSRLSYLLAVGLDYLTLGRQARTLSGGEAQRIHLASALGSSLTDTLYVLDEPTIGLHARDSRKLLRVLTRLTRMGNTVVVVEHDPTVIEGAHHVIDLGPGGGALGGEVLFEGTVAGLRRASTRTGRLLRKPKPLRLAVGEPDGQGPAITLVGARENNLRDLDVRVPLGRLVCVTGVSGAGKSSLVEQVLYNGYLRMRGKTGVEAGKVERIEGLEKIEEMVLMSQAHSGRSTRSLPVTYCKAWEKIRRLFAATREARRLGITGSHFSFNTVAGRCSACRGTGTVTVEMHFMADLVLRCEVCGGKRFRPEVLEVRYKGRNIDEVLDMTVSEAQSFFAESPDVVGKLASLAAVGLGYLRLGQTTTSLSGGEAQRLKLASYMELKGARGGRLFLFDEPTTGLHRFDIQKLLGAMERLLKQGNSLVVVEHNLDFISQAHHIIDLGPGGGEQGGQIVVEGPPEAVMRARRSVTGRWLRRHLKRG
ncbi:MAG: excinuclease ABC subunit UvrA [bacterium]|nr:excinuclease ABC subunit UvrA [bacterium]